MSKLIQPFARYLSDTGADDGGKNLADVADVYWIEDADPRGVTIHELLILVHDVDIQPLEFGGLGAALATGSLLKHTTALDADIHDFTDGVPITTNAGLWGLGERFGEPVAAIDGAYVVRITFPGGLFLAAGEKLSYETQDDLTALTSHTIFARGHFDMA